MFFRINGIASGTAIKVCYREENVYGILGMVCMEVERERYPRRPSYLNEDEYNHFYVCVYVYPNLKMMSECSIAPPRTLGSQEPLRRFDEEFPKIRSPRLYLQ